MGIEVLIAVLVVVEFLIVASMAVDDVMSGQVAVETDNEMLNFS